MPKIVYAGKFYNDFAGFEISKSGETIKCYEHAAPIGRRFKIYNPGTPYAYFDAPVCGGVVRYNLSDFVKGGKNEQN